MARTFLPTLGSEPKIPASHCVNVPVWSSLPGKVPINLSVCRWASAFRLPIRSSCAKTIFRSAEAVSAVPDASVTAGSRRVRWTVSASKRRTWLHVALYQSSLGYSPPSVPGPLVAALKDPFAENASRCRECRPGVSVNPSRCPRVTQSYPLCLISLCRVPGLPRCLPIPELTPKGANSPPVTNRGKGPGHRFPLYFSCWTLGSPSGHPCRKVPNGECGTN